VLANVQLPRKVNIHTGLDHNTRPNLRTEEAKQIAFESRRPRQRTKEKQTFNYMPECFKPFGSTAFEAFFGVKLAKIYVMIHLNNLNVFTTKDL
jgi:hypothetical protein